MKTPGTTGMSGAGAAAGLPAGGDDDEAAAAAAAAAPEDPGHMGADMDAVMRPQAIHIWPQAIHMPCSDTEAGGGGGQWEAEDAESSGSWKLDDEAPAVTSGGQAFTRADDCIRSSCPRPSIADPPDDDE